MPGQLNTSAPLTLNVFILPLHSINRLKVGAIKHSYRRDFYGRSGVIFHATLCYCKYNKTTSRITIGSTAQYILLKNVLQHRHLLNSLPTLFGMLSLPPFYPSRYFFLYYTGGPLLFCRLVGTTTSRSP